MRIIAIAALAVALTLWAEDSARIYVYAQRGTAAHSWLSISCGSAVVAELKRGTFFAINVTPGRHISSIEEGVPAFVEVHPGEDSFVRLDWSFETGRPPVPALSKVPPAEARTEMKYLNYVGDEKVHSPLVPKIDPRRPVEPGNETHRPEISRELPFSIAFSLPQVYT